MLFRSIAPKCRKRNVDIPRFFSRPIPARSALQQIWTNGAAAGPRDEDAARLTATARPELRPIRGAEAMAVRADGAGRGYGRSREGRGCGW